MLRPLYRNWWLRLLKLLRLKRSEPVPLTASVLIIGSLLWDSEKERPAWRAARLDLAGAQTVTAPHLHQLRILGNSYRPQIAPRFTNKIPAQPSRHTAYLSTVPL